MLRNEEQAVVSRNIYDWYPAEGLSIAAITRRLNDQGHTDTQARLAMGTHNRLWAMLRSEASFKAS